MDGEEITGELHNSWGEEREKAVAGRHVDGGDVKREKEINGQEQRKTRGSKRNLNTGAETEEESLRRQIEVITTL